MARKQKTKQSKEQPKNKLENNRQSIATYGSDDTMGAPLTVEVTATTGRLEMLEENRKVTLQASLHFGDDVHSAWGNVPKTEVVSGLLDVEFTQVQKIDKDARGDAQFVRTKAETNVTHQESRTHEGETEQQRLQPRENTLRKRPTEGMPRRLICEARAPFHLVHVNPGVDGCRYLKMSTTQHTEEATKGRSTLAR